MIAPRLPSFFKSQPAKQFEHKPRYYDPEKEERQQRRERIKHELEGEKKEHNPEIFRSRLRERWERPSKIKHKSYSSMIRLLIIVAILTYLSYYILH